MPEVNIVLYDQKQEVNIVLRGGMKAVFNPQSSTNDEGNNDKKNNQRESAEHQRVIRNNQINSTAATNGPSITKNGVRGVAVDNNNSCCYQQQSTAAAYLPPISRDTNSDQQQEEDSRIVESSTLLQNQKRKLANPPIRKRRVTLGDAETISAASSGSSSSHDDDEALSLSALVPEDANYGDVNRRGRTTANPVRSNAAAAHPPLLLSSNCLMYHSDTDVAFRDRKNRHSSFGAGGDSGRNNNRSKYNPGSHHQHYRGRSSAASGGELADRFSSNPADGSMPPSGSLSNLTGSSPSNDDEDDDDEDDDSTQSTSTIFPVALDGGYGWVIVIAAFMVHLIADGISFSFGVFYPFIQRTYNANKAESAMVGSIFMALPLLAGPVAASLTDHFGFRWTTIVGGLGAALGFFLTTYVRSLPYLYLTFGLVSGLGLSLCFNSAIVAVTYYFDAHRALATGLTVCGTGIGTFIFAPLIDYLLACYSWEGAVLVLSGILLNLCVCGALLRDLEWPEDTLEYKTEKFNRVMAKESRAADFGMVGGGLASQGPSTREPSLHHKFSYAGGAFHYHHRHPFKSSDGRAASMIEFPTHLRIDFAKQKRNDVNATSSTAADKKTSPTAVSCGLSSMPSTRIIPTNAKSNISSNNKFTRGIGIDSAAAVDDNDKGQLVDKRGGRSKSVGWGLADDRQGIETSHILGHPLPEIHRVSPQKQRNNISGGANPAANRADSHHDNQRKPMPNDIVQNVPQRSSNRFSEHQSCRTFSSSASSSFENDDAAERDLEIVTLLPSSLRANNNDKNTSQGGGHDPGAASMPPKTLPSNLLDGKSRMNKQQLKNRHQEEEGEKQRQQQQQQQQRISSLSSDQLSTTSNQQHQHQQFLRKTPAGAPYESNISLIPRSAGNNANSTAASSPDADVEGGGGGTLLLPATRPTRMMQHVVPTKHIINNTRSRQSFSGGRFRTLGHGGGHNDGEKDEMIHDSVVQQRLENPRSYSLLEGHSAASAAAAAATAASATRPPSDTRQKTDTQPVLLKKKQIRKQKEGRAKAEQWLESVQAVQYDNGLPTTSTARMLSESDQNGDRITYSDSVQLLSAAGGVGPPNASSLSHPRSFNSNNKHQQSNNKHRRSSTLQSYPTNQLVAAGRHFLLSPHTTNGTADGGDFEGTTTQTTLRTGSTFASSSIGSASAGTGGGYHPRTATTMTGVTSVATSATLGTVATTATTPVVDGAGGGPTGGQQKPPLTSASRPTVPPTRYGPLLPRRLDGIVHYHNNLMYQHYYNNLMMHSPPKPFVSEPALRMRHGRRGKRRKQNAGSQNATVLLMKRFLKECRETVFEDVQLLKSLPNLLLYTFYDIPYVNLPEYTIAIGSTNEPEASFLVSIMGMTNTFGMILYGLLADNKYVSNVLFYGVSCVICGICIGVTPWLPSSYPLIATVCGVFGFFISANYTLTSVILLELLSLSDFAYAYGLVCFVQGIGTLIGPPIAGFLFDVTGSYWWTFVTGGSGIAISGFLVISIAILLNKSAPSSPPRMLGGTAESKRQSSNNDTTTHTNVNHVTCDTFIIGEEEEEAKKGVET